MSEDEDTKVPILPMVDRRKTTQVYATSGQLESFSKTVRDSIFRLYMFFIALVAVLAIISIALLYSVRDSAHDLRLELHERTGDRITSGEVIRLIERRDK